MPFTFQQSIEFINIDQNLINALVQQLINQKVTHHNEVVRIIEEFIVASLSDRHGYLKPNALTIEEINLLESSLQSLFSPGVLDQQISEAINIVDARLLTIDDLMISLELDEAILGAQVFEMEVVQESIDNLAAQYAVGAYGSQDYQGSVNMIADAMNRYRLDRSKSEFTLRSELMDTLRVASNAGANYANTHAITSMASIDRELKRVQAAEAGIETGLYAGPFDDLIRPFCDEWLGIVMEYTFWDNLSNDMPPGQYDTPVSFYCGGYNCRHRIIPYQLEWSNGNRDLRSEFV